MKEYKVNFNNGGYSPKQKRFWTKVLIMAVAIWLTCIMFPVANGTLLGALVAAIVISLLNAFVRPALTIISLPLIIGSFGLFYLLINALIVLLTAWLIPSFSVNGFGGAILFIIIVNIISWLLELMSRLNRKTVEQKQEQESEFTNYEDITDEENKNENNVGI
jgi:putative membrane protein